MIEIPSMGRATAIKQSMLIIHIDVTTSTTSFIYFKYKISYSFDVIATLKDGIFKKSEHFSKV